MSLMPWEIVDDFEIKINDVVDGQYTGEFLSLSGDDGVCGARFDSVGSPDLRDATYVVSGGDGIRFGIERYGAINWTITGSIHGTTITNAPGSPDLTWQAWSRLARAWVDYPGRSEPRSVIPLYFKRPGREEMVVFGRPRRIDPDTTTSYDGFISYTALFMQSDPRFYSAYETSVDIPLSASVAGGILLDDTYTALPVPFMTTSTVRSTVTIAQNGDTSTNPVISFHGPVQNPQIIFYDTMGEPMWSAQLLMSIQNGQVIDIDARHWSRAIIDQYNTSFAGYYRGARLQDLTIPPGTYQLDFEGIDDTGTCSCQISFRNAWSST